MGFEKEFNTIASLVNNNSKVRGWWDKKREDKDFLLLCHAELTDAARSLANGNQPDKCCPEFSSFEIELVDIILRIMDLSVGKKYRIAEAIIAKMTFNLTRDY